MEMERGIGAIEVYLFLLKHLVKGRSDVTENKAMDVIFWQQVSNMILNLSPLNMGVFYSETQYMDHASKH